MRRTVRRANRPVEQEELAGHVRFALSRADHGANLRASQLVHGRREHGSHSGVQLGAPLEHSLAVPGCHQAPLRWGQDILEHHDKDVTAVVTATFDVKH